ncbi:hypothetical protein C8J57DRAFT_1244463 [Mycena rebaudengoi]|nr:hypothetical protein C8J57DRAFT_1244463 [Mycena rebaudengoi]
MSRFIRFFPFRFPFCLALLAARLALRTHATFSPISTLFLSSSYLLSPISPTAGQKSTKSGVGAKIGVKSAVLGVMGSKRTRNEGGRSEGTLEPASGELQGIWVVTRRSRTRRWDLCSGQGELGNKEVIYRREGSKASWWVVGSGTGGQHAFGSICAGLRSWSAKLRNGWRRVCAAARRSGERRAQQRRSPVSFEMSLALSARLMLAAQKLRPHPRDFQPAAGFRVPFENGWVEFSVSGLISIHETSAKYFCQVEKRKRSILDRDDEGNRNERPPASKVRHTCGQLPPINENGSKINGYGVQTRRSSMQDIRPRFVSAWVCLNAVLANVCPVPKPNRLRAKTSSSRDVNPALSFSERRYFTINVALVHSITKQIATVSLSMSWSIMVTTLHMI